VTKRKARDGPPKGPESFRDYARGVRRLTSDSQRVPPPKERPPARPTARDASAPRFDVRDDGQVIEGVRSGFDELLGELESDRFPIHGTLDLHGLSAERARRELLAFCKSARGPSRRVVLIVHGKGAHSPGGRGVLRDEIAGWLSSPPLAAQVLCFATAPERRGGAGAVYVLLGAWS
jgi:DNA-nicking Smr family endonuclease